MRALNVECSWTELLEHGQRLIARLKGLRLSRREILRPLAKLQSLLYTRGQPLIARDRGSVDSVDTTILFQNFSEELPSRKDMT